jgi:Family of unknown function (DUF6049)
VSSRRARTALCTLALALAALVNTVGAAAAGAAEQAGSGGPPLVLLTQTPWVSATQPWFNLTLGVSPTAGAASGLHVSMTFFGRFDDASDLQQAMTGTPTGTPLLRVTDVPVTAGAGGLTAGACVTVLPDADATAPSSGPGICTAGVPGGTLTMSCTSSLDECQGVYAVSVALERTGSSTPLSRFTTFMTYQQPAAMSASGGPLRVGVVLPLSAGGVAAAATPLAAHPDVATTLAVSPLAVSALASARGHQGEHALDQLAALDGDQLLDQPYVPINLVALSEAGIANEIGVQMGRGDELLRAAGLKPDAGPWVDTTSSFSQGDAASLASGLQLAGASGMVVSNADLSSGGESNQTFAQPFTLDLAHGVSVPAVAADANLSARFTAAPGNPVLGAEQLLAGLSFVHFENPFFSAPRGVVVTPAPGWQPTAAFLNALLDGLSGNQILKPVTLNQLLAQVPAGGNREPVVRQLQAGAADHGITRGSADRIATDRAQLSSFSLAVDGHPATLTVLGDALLTTEQRGLSAAARGAALTAYARSFAGTTGQVTLATERTVTFTSQRADIPVTVLSSAPYPVTVVVTLSSDKFTFPNGNSRQLVLNRPTTSWRFEAQARTSGDRLPIEVTLHTPNGQVLIAHTVLTVHATEISFVGVALTVLAGAVLLFWWVRTWRRSRRARPRAH